MRKIIAIVGPTAVGKSRLAIQLARSFHGEIINADSRQIYHYMDIGTAKPTNEEMQQIPHHLLDIIYPDEAFSLSTYKNLALQKIDEVLDRARLPFLVGGTGQYIWSLLEGWEVPHVPPHGEFRKTMELKAGREGYLKLFEELQAVDPQAARKIMPTNVRRVIRALEIYHFTHRPISQMWIKKGTTFQFLIIGLTMERYSLYDTIDKRVDQMIQDGFIQEVHNLLNMGYKLDLPSMSSIGYRQMGMYFKGQISLCEAIQQIKYETHRFVRKQYTWFKHQDTRITWFDVTTDIQDNINNLIYQFLNKY